MSPAHTFLAIAALVIAPPGSAVGNAGNSEIEGAGSSQAAARLATETLAARLDVDPSTIEVISVASEAWPGPGVRCGNPTTDEQEPRISGYRVRLRFESSTFDVRVAEGSARICGIGPHTAPFEPGRIEPALHQQVQQAKMDLSSRQHTTPDKIEVLEAVTVVWRDSSLGCPQPGMEYLQVLTKGTRIRLRFGHAVFHYHGVGDRPPVYCERPAKIEPLPVETAAE